MHIGAKAIENLLMITVLKINTLKEYLYKSQKTSFYKFLFIWKLIKHIPIWNCYPKRLLMKPKVILLKPSWINHCHWKFVVESLEYLEKFGEVAR